MDKEFIAKGLIALTPVTLASVVFFLLSLHTYGVPNASQDILGTHFPAKVESYSFLLPAVNSTVRSLVGPWYYNFWFFLMEFAVCYAIPYIFIYEISKKHEYAVFFIYASFVATSNFTTGTLPQALIIDLILVMIARPSWFWGVLVVSAFTHAFGVIFILMAKAWLFYDSEYLRSASN